MLPFPFPLSWEMTTGLIYYLSFNSMFYPFFYILCIHKQHIVLKSYINRIVLYVSFCSFFLSIFFSDMSSCRSNLLNHLIFKPLTSIALFTCPVKKYPTYQSPRLSHIVHKNFSDFFFPTGCDLSHF